MALIRKLALNLGPSALSALGPAGYLRYLCAITLTLPQIVRTRGFRPLDRRMGRRQRTLRCLGSNVTIDCPTADRIVTDGTYTFGIVRELVIRNCYLRHGVNERVSGRAVVDLGANRGVFTAIAGALGASRVLAVETLPPLREAIVANAALNRLDRCEIESVFVGAGGTYERRKGETARLAHLLDAHGIDRVGVIKIDIEGSEFALFDEAGWLERVDAICMEVHPEHGDVQRLLDTLSTAGFSTRTGDHMFRAVSDPQQAEFVWAVR